MAGGTDAALAGVQLINGVQQAEAMKSEALAKRALAGLNAEYTEIDAFNAIKDGYTQSARYQSSIDKIMADQEVHYASLGVDSSSGTAAELKQENSVTGFLNQLDIVNQARTKAQGLFRQATLIRTQGQLDYQFGMQKANAALMSSMINAGATGASGYMKSSATTSPSSTPLGLSGEGGAVGLSSSGGSTPGYYLQPG